MLRSLKLAMPLTLVFRRKVPNSVAAVGFVPSDRVTAAFATTLANASVTFTSTAGVMWTPAVVEVGCTKNVVTAAGPATKVTDGWSFSTTCARPGLAVAVNVFSSALVELMLVTKTPVTGSVVTVVGEKVFPEPVGVTETETGRLPIG